MLSYGSTYNDTNDHKFYYIGANLKSSGSNAYYQAYGSNPASISSEVLSVSERIEIIV